MENGRTEHPLARTVQPAVIDLTLGTDSGGDDPIVPNSKLDPLAVAGPVLNTHGSPVKGEPSASDEDAGSAGSAWADESFFEEQLGEIEDHEYSDRSSDNCCSLQEAKALRMLLRQVGWDRFIERTLISERYTARKLCTAFSVSLSDQLDGLSDDQFIPVLGALMQRALSKRERLTQFNTPSDAARLLQTCNNIVVITGAGISTNLGIPDFRSKGTGLYSRLAHLGLNDPQEAFSMELFKESPEIFYSVAKDIYPSSKRFSPTHAFIRLLQDKGKLLTNFTQNIDNLEEAAGIEDNRLIQCHGSWRRATCQVCRFNVSGSEIEADLKEGKVAHCKACLRALEQVNGINRKRKRSHSNKPNKRRRAYFEDSTSEEGEFDEQQPGVMKPDITFFGEDLPSNFHERLLEHDKDKVDLCLVIGTSLKVSPVADIPDFLPPNVPQIYVSRDPVNHVQFDIELLGDCDTIMTELCKRAGWELTHEMIKEGTAVKDSRYGEESWRWNMNSREGGIIDAKDMDEGTLGHGRSLSPVAARKTADQKLA